jgi:hypothetical protein
LTLEVSFETSSAEKEGFEPPDLLQSTVFKTAAFDRSAISPVCRFHFLNASANIISFFDLQCAFVKLLKNNIEASVFLAGRKRGGNLIDSVRRKNYVKKTECFSKVVSFSGLFLAQA